MSEIFIYDEIGPDWAGMVSAQYVQNELNKNKGKPITVRINSPGGSVFEAQAIYNMLRRHGQQITTAIDSLAASAASFVAMAGDKIEIAANAFVMIHEASSLTMGNKAEHLKTIELLDMVDQTLIDIYMARTGGKSTREDIAAWLAAETWMTAQEAVDRGFADAIGQALNVSACLKEGRYKNAPSAIFATALPRETRRDAMIENVRLQKRLTNARK